MTQHHYTLQWAAPFPKIAPSQGTSGPPSNSTWFLGPTQVLSPNSIYYCDRLTDHATQSVTIGRINVHSIAMRPKLHPNNYHEMISTKYWHYTITNR